MTEREQCERFPPGARKWVGNVEVEWQPTCIDPPGETGMDPCWPCFEYLREQLTAAEALNVRYGRNHQNLITALSTTRSALERIAAISVVRNVTGYGECAAIAAAALKEIEE